MALMDRAASTQIQTFVGLADVEVRLVSGIVYSVPHTMPH